MTHEYEFFTGPLTILPEDDKGERIRGVQRFVIQNAKQGYRLVFLERLMGSDDFVATMERPVKDKVNYAGKPVESADNAG